MTEALRKASAGGCNEGFLRPDANLVVVIVTDEEDSSPQQVSSYVNDLIAAKSDASRVRLATIVGSRNGQAARCGSQPTCGGLCNQPRPPGGSGNACSAPANCAADEVCSNRVCISKDSQFWDSFCWWCSYYTAPDCCSADEGGRYVEFARELEQRITQSVPAIPVSNCIAPVGTRAACLIDSICQNEFAATLARIARDLILSNEFILEPPASYPPGVVVKLNGTPLVQCNADNAATCGFTVNVNADGLGVSVSVPGAGEGDEIEIYYITPE